VDVNFVDSVDVSVLVGIDENSLGGVDGFGRVPDVGSVFGVVVISMVGVVVDSVVVSVSTEVGLLKVEVGTVIVCVGNVPYVGVDVISVELLVEVVNVDNVEVDGVVQVICGGGTQPVVVITGGVVSSVVILEVNTLVTVGVI